MYKLAPINPYSGQLDTVVRLSDNAFIPINQENRDYQEYLKWVAEGNTPQPAEE